MPRIRARLKGLRHREGWYFSPLFIGELPSTVRLMAMARSSSIFQSPLHRGTPFNWLPSQLWVAVNTFQSPLHRGTPFNPSSSWPSPRRPQISVPSSSGNSLQPLFSCPVFSTIQRCYAGILRKPPTCWKYWEVCENPRSQPGAFISLSLFHLCKSLLIQKISPQ